MTQKRKEKILHILVVDDDNRLRALLEKFLRDNNFLVNSASSANEANEYLKLLKFDLIILDVMMPGENGLQFAEKLRKNSPMPILMLTAMSESKDRIDGLQKGVDDYMGKPFDPQELLLRIKAILRRIKEPKRKKNDELVFGDCIYNINKNILIRKGLNIHLTLAETDLLRILAINANLPVNRSIIINAGSTLNNPRTVDVHITRLRKKIEIEPHNPRYLQTIRGKGYLLRTN